ncbi:MAG TPA: ribosome maturation factor RimM [Sphingomicrobium sp.]|jgi:16S rRNA processing protein RimM|nr:ribosome maturation factor RimM [Sphingomicrobium sp.]
MAEQRIALAAVAGAHGIRGELRLKLFTDAAENLARHKLVFLDGQEMMLQSCKDGGKTAIARLAGVNSREQAEALRGSLVEVDRSALPALEQGEYYHADLLGLPCVDGEGRTLGTVSAIENFGAGDLLEIEDKEGKRTLVPFRPGVADLQDNRIVVDPLFLA